MWEQHDNLEHGFRSTFARDLSDQQVDTLAKEVEGVVETAIAELEEIIKERLALNPRINRQRPQKTLSGQMP